jgi:uncharacterized RDD family membrane protein YckC
MLNKPMHDRTAPAKGVYYRQEDYASIFRRTLTAVIDLAVLLFAMMLVTIVKIILDPVGKTSSASIFWIGLGLSYLYLAILKRTRIGTLGYLLTGVRIVDLEGKKPPLLAMTGRFLLLMLGWFFLFFDIAWLIGDKHRQTLRDKLAGTYVIRKSAKPLGTGVQSIVPYHMLGLALMFREVKETSRSTHGASPASQADE